MAKEKIYKACISLLLVIFGSSHVEALSPLQPGQQKKLHAVAEVPTVTPPPSQLPSKDKTDKDHDASRTPSETQRRAGVIASSFQPDCFDPWITNCHIQTIGGFLLRDTPAAYLPKDDPIQALSRIVQGISSKLVTETSQPKPRFWDIRERIETPDGDWFHADTKFATATTTGEKPENDVRVILLHGLESNSDSELSKQMASAYVAQGMTTTCINFRSCSQDENGELIPNDTLKGYHLGFTDDLLHYLERLKKQSPQTKVFLSGFSLGANVALKALGELGDNAMERYNIHGAAVACAPFKQEVSYIAFHQPGINREFYQSGLLKKLKQKARNQVQQLYNGNENIDAFDYHGCEAATTIYEFEDAYIAPIFGFDSFMDYYEKTSSIHFLETIGVPTLILNAVDDPFFDPSVNPIEMTQEHGGVAPIKLVRTPHGGHLGFCFHRVENGDDGRLQYGIRECENDNVPSRYPSSWLPTELARFLHHVQTYPTALDCPMNKEEEGKDY